MQPGTCHGLHPGEFGDLNLDPAQPRQIAVTDVHHHRPSRAATSPPAPSHRSDLDPARTQRDDRRMPRTCVFFHAHPDDEALLTGGTMAGRPPRDTGWSWWSPPPGRTACPAGARRGRPGTSCGPQSWARRPPSSAAPGCTTSATPTPGSTAARRPVPAARRRSRRSPCRGSRRRSPSAARRTRRPGHRVRPRRRLRPPRPPAGPPRGRGRRPARRNAGAAGGHRRPCPAAARPPDRGHGLPPSRRGRRPLPGDAYTPRRRSASGSTFAPGHIANAPHCPRTQARPPEATPSARLPRLSALPLPLFRRGLGVEWYIRRRPTEEH